MKKINFKHLVLFVALMIATISVFAIANAAATDYASGYYVGTVSAEDGADVMKDPGSASEHVKNAAGENLHVPTGTEVTITAEQCDQDLDVWYYTTFTYEGAEYSGYIYINRVSRKEAVVTFTPTPTPSPTPTPEVATAGDADPTITPEMNKDTAAMVNKSGTFEPYKYIIVLCIVIVVVMIVYTIWVKTNEEKLEKEIERYSGRPKYEPLEGELSEDYEEAKASYYDHIGLGDQSEKNLGEEIGNPDEIHLDMSGVFGDEEEFPVEYEEEYIEEEYTDDDSLENLIASLEDKIPEEDGTDELSFNSDVFEEEVPVRKPVRRALTPERYLASLNSGDVIDHKVYGEGVVIDNTDDEIIQVEFNGNMKFLKKDKLIAKSLLKM